MHAAGGAAPYDARDAQVPQRNVEGALGSAASGALSAAQQVCWAVQLSRRHAAHRCERRVALAAARGPLAAVARVAVRGREQGAAHARVSTSRQLCSPPPPSARCASAHPLDALLEGLELHRSGSLPKMDRSWALGVRPRPSPALWPPRRRPDLEISRLDLKSRKVPSSELQAAASALREQAALRRMPRTAHTAAQPREPGWAPAWPSSYARGLEKLRRPYAWGGRGAEV